MSRCHQRGRLTDTSIAMKIECDTRWYLEVTNQNQLEAIAQTENNEHLTNLYLRDREREKRAIMKTGKENDRGLGRNEIAVAKCSWGTFENTELRQDRWNNMDVWIASDFGKIMYFSAMTSLAKVSKIRSDIIIACSCSHNNIDLRETTESCFHIITVYLGASINFVPVKTLVLIL